MQRMPWPLPLLPWPVLVPAHGAHGAHGVHGVRDSLLARDSIESVQEWHDSLADETAALRDISSDVCWHAGFTKERCCRGDPSTTKDCWDGSYSFGECCPNADCWMGETFTYDFCCADRHGPEGNQACWSGDFTHQLCCLANATSNSWADILASEIETEQFYQMDDFYTDAQYGDEWGYYSKGHVLLGGGKGGQGQEQTQQFAHFTTYPMALSPHFARVFCRLLFIMWVGCPADTCVVPSHFNCHEVSPWKVSYIYKYIQYIDMTNKYANNEL